MDKSVPVFQVATFEDLQAVFYGQERLGTGVMTFFAAAGLLLVLLGVHGITSYTAAQRIHEIAVRMAFGASGSQIVWMILRHTAALSAAGLAIGLVGAAAVSRSLDRFVPGMQGANPSLFVVPIVMLACVTIMAAVVPAWRATRMDPLGALRDR